MEDICMYQKGEYHSVWMFHVSLPQYIRKYIFRVHNKKTAISQGILSFPCFTESRHAWVCLFWILKEELVSPEVIEAVECILEKWTWKKWLERERDLIAEVLKEGGDDAEKLRQSEAASGGKGSIPSDLSFMSTVTYCQSDIYSSLFCTAPSTLWCPLALLQTFLLYCVGICCTTEKTKEQQGDSACCIMGSSVIHTEISGNSAMGSSGCVIKIVTSVLPTILFIKVLFFLPGKPLNFTCKLFKNGGYSRCLIFIGSSRVYCNNLRWPTNVQLQ